MQNILLFFYVTVVSLFMVLPFQASAEQVSVGAGGFFQTTPYKKHDGRILPIPFLSYEGEYFFVRGMSAGAHLWKNERHAFSASISYLPLSFSHKQTTDSRMRKLSDRKSSATADLTYTISGCWGTGSLKVSQDILGYSDGVIFDASYAYPLFFASFKVTPTIGIEWVDNAYTDYYYGISQKEARKSELNHYSPNDAFSPYLGINAVYSISNEWHLIGHFQGTLLSSEIINSPMVDKKVVLTGGAGIQYSF